MDTRKNNDISSVIEDKIAEFSELEMQDSFELTAKSISMGEIDAVVEGFDKMEDEPESGPEPVTPNNSPNLLSGQDLYRFYPSEFNDLIGSTVKNIPDCELESGSYEPTDAKPSKYYILQKQDVRRTRFIVCETVKDSDDSPNADYLFSFRKLLKYLYARPELVQNAMVLIPVLQCKELFASYRMHSVLVEIDFRKKKVAVHDSKKKWAAFLDKDALEAIVNEVMAGEGFSYHYIHHGSQKLFETYSCGYIVLNSLLEILLNNHSNHVGATTMDFGDFYSNKHEFKKVYGENKGTSLFFTQSPDDEYTVLNVELPDVNVELPEDLQRRRSI